MAVPNMWRIKSQRYRLQGEVCPACSRAVFPPRQVCPRCGSSFDGRQGRQTHAAPLMMSYQPQTILAEVPAGDD